VGVTPDQQTRLWQPFSQIEAGIRQQGKGSGLGLHICKEIIRHHGGRVGVRSTPGQGSTFFADIPFQVCRAPSSDGLLSESGASSVAATHITPAPTASIGEGLQVHPRLQRITWSSSWWTMVRDCCIIHGSLNNLLTYIVCMCAVASNRVFLTRALKRQLPKSEVYEAEDGRQAVQMVTADLAKYHVVCMDKEMPVCNSIPCIVHIPTIVPVICLIDCLLAGFAGIGRVWCYS
jgi:CheY-like chemotaxis protein